MLVVCWFCAGCLLCTWRNWCLVALCLCFCLLVCQLGGCFVYFGVCWVFCLLCCLSFGLGFGCLGFCLRFRLICLYCLLLVRWLSFFVGFC